MNDGENAREAAEAAGRETVIKRVKILLKSAKTFDEATVAQVAQDLELWGIIRRQMGVDPERVVNEIVKVAYNELVAEKATGREAFDKEVRDARKRTTE